MKSILTLCMLLLLNFALFSCHSSLREGPAERAGRNFDEVLDNTEDSLEDIEDNFDD